MEAFIDFEETETIDNNIIDDVVINIKKLINDINIHISNGYKGEILRSGVKTVIVGEPNVGKSSLLNNLCNKPRAIVSPIEGTTRDLLEVTININGYPLILTDTAGLRKNTTDVIEKEGIDRAVDSIKSSDLILYVIDINKYLNNNKFDDNLLSNNLKSYNFDNKQYLIICNKTDLVDNNILENLKNNFTLISCKTKSGFDNLYNDLNEKLKEM